MQAAAALAVNVGSFSDPWDVQVKPWEILSIDFFALSFSAFPHFCHRMANIMLIHHAPPNGRTDQSLWGRGQYGSLDAQKSSSLEVTSSKVALFWLLLTVWTPPLQIIEYNYACITLYI